MKYFVFKCHRCGRWQASYSTKEDRLKWWMNCKFCKAKKRAYVVKKNIGIVPNYPYFFVFSSYSDARAFLLSKLRKR